MGMHALLVSLPAIVALLFKAGIFFYARSSAVRNQQTRLYLYFLFAFSVQNIAEIFGFHTLIDQGVIPHVEATVFYVAVIVALALLLHLTLGTAFSGDLPLKRAVIRGYYGYAVILELLLLLTPWLIQGYTPLNYTVTRIPGPVYFLFELYAVGGFLVIVGALTYGARYAGSAFGRTQNKVLLLAIAPLALTAIAVVSLLHVGAPWVNASVTFPIAITYFLAVTAYAIHQHRLFDIEFFIPGSKVRRRKTAFYRRLQAVIAEIADLDSVEQAVRRLADTLGCGVTLIGGNRPVLAQAGASPAMAQIPRSVLTRFDHIVVANEIADTLPEVHRAMRTHGVAAIVPFHPHSQQAAGWLVLGDAFSEQVYTARDFRLVEQLFDKMADLFLDKLITMRTQLADAVKQVRLLERRQEELRVNVELLQQQNAALVGQNELLRKQQPVDSLGTGLLPVEMAPNICILGRDKAVTKALRRSFPQAAHYVSAASAGFKRQSAPDLLIAHLGDNDVPADAEALAAWLATDSESALLLTGAGAARFAGTTDFGARLVEVVAAPANDDMLARRAHALTELRRATCTISDPEQPLIGRSAAFTAALTEAQRVARLTDPVVLNTDDVEQGLSLAAYIHAASGTKGAFFAWRAAQSATIDERLAQAGGGVLAVDWSVVADDARAELLQALRVRHDVRLLVVAPIGAKVDLGPTHPFSMALPRLRERRADLPLLVHYFTLAFNRRTGAQRYLRQAEIDEMLQERYPDTVGELRRQVQDALVKRLPEAEVDLALAARLEEKTLDQHIAEYEAYLIEQTLQRCGGNKSQAARLLGLRPNTLHYKLARFARITVDKEE